MLIRRLRSSTRHSPLLNLIAFRRVANAAFEVLNRVAPEIGTEIHSLVTEISSSLQVCRPQASAERTSFCWGALFTRADTHRTLVTMIDGLTHEAHTPTSLSLSLGDSFVTNPDDELHLFALAA